MTTDLKCGLRDGDDEPQVKVLHPELNHRPPIPLKRSEATLAQGKAITASGHRNGTHTA